MAVGRKRRAKGVLPQWLNFLWILSLRGSIIYNDNKVDYDKRKCRHIRPGRAGRAFGSFSERQGKVVQLTAYQARVIYAETISVWPLVLSRVEGPDR